jgi:hypothetical protein
MVRVENPREYRLLGFKRSQARNKKYDAILQNKITGRIRRVPFGQLGYEHYRDSTGLGLYSHLDHNDPARRRNYLGRHRKDKDSLFSSGYFAAKYLW